MTSGEWIPRDTISPMAYHSQLTNELDSNLLVIVTSPLIQTRYSVLGIARTYRIRQEVIGVHHALVFVEVLEEVSPHRMTTQ